MEPEKTLLALLDLTTAFLTSTSELLRKRIHSTDHTHTADHTHTTGHTEKQKKHRSKTGYQLFTDNYLLQLKTSSQDTRNLYAATKLGDLAKQVSAKWKQLTPVERAQWKNQASAVKPVDPALLNLLEEDTVPERKKRGDLHLERTPTPTETESEED